MKSSLWIVFAKLVSQFGSRIMLPYISGLVIKLLNLKSKHCFKEVNPFLWLSDYLYLA